MMIYLDGDYHSRYSIISWNDDTNSKPPGEELSSSPSNLEPSKHWRPIVFVNWYWSFQWQKNFVGMLNPHTLVYIREPQYADHNSKILYCFIYKISMLSRQCLDQPIHTASGLCSSSSRPHPFYKDPIIDPWWLLRRSRSWAKKKKPESTGTYMVCYAAALNTSNLRILMSHDHS